MLFYDWAISPYTGGNDTHEADIFRKSALREIPNREAAWVRLPLACLSAFAMRDLSRSLTVSRRFKPDTPWYIPALEEPGDKNSKWPIVT